MPELQDGQGRKRSRSRSRKKLVLMSLIASLVQPTRGQIQDQAVANLLIDFSWAGQVAAVGDYDGISLYNYASQISSSGSAIQDSFDRLLWQAPDGHIIPWNQTNGSINSICNIDDIIYFGGNFSTVGSLTTSPSIASIHFNNGSLQALNSGLPAAQVNTLYCDQTQRLVYIGGNFTFENTTNAAIWNLSSQTFSALPFGGFSDGIINSIAPFNGSVIFAGNFTRLGLDYQTVSTSNATNYTTSSSDGNASQPIDSETMVPFGSANVSATGSSTDSQYSDPASILCSQDDSNWLLASGSQGTWEASFPFGFQPTKLRIKNAAVDNYGAQIFRYISTDDGGIMNLTYTDSQGSLSYCDAWCALESYDDNKDFTDFNFVNPISMSGFRLEFFGYYGQAAGLSGLELYQNQSISYAVGSMNEPLSCQRSAAPTNFSTVSTVGSWSQPTLLDGQKGSYLSATAQSSDDDFSVTYFPVTPYSGNYTVLVYTPGCLADDTCAQRGTVNATLNFSPNETAISQTLAQSNEELKFDIIYQGPIYIDDGFVPNLTLSMTSDQTTSYPKTVVAQSIGVKLDSIFSLKEGNITTEEPFYFGGIFEYLSSNFSINNLNTSVGNTTINSLGYLLDNGTEITSLASINDKLFVGGSYRGENISSNFMVMNSSSGIVSLPAGDLNGSIFSLKYDNITSSLIITGNFSGSAFGINNLSNIASYSLDNDTWHSFEGGINHTIKTSIPLNLSISNVSHPAIAFMSSSEGLDELDIWLSDSSEWLDSVKNSLPLIRGQLSSGLSLNDYNILAGQLVSSPLAASSVAYLDSNQTISSLPITIGSSESSDISSDVFQNVLKKRDAFDLLAPDSAVLTSAFYNRSDGQVLTIYGGHFSALSDDVQYENLVVFSNESSALTFSNISSGQYNLSSSNTIRSLFVHNKTLHVGGDIVGSYGQQPIEGLAMFDLEEMTISAQQVPGLSGSGIVQVNSITGRPNSNQILVGGIFDHAGSLDCPGLCIYDWDNLRWQSPFYGLSGNVSTIAFIDANTALIAGNLSGNGTNIYALTYNLANGKVTHFGNTTTSLPGPVNLALVGHSGTSSIIVSGQTQSNPNNSFLYAWDGDNWSNIGSGIEADSVLTYLNFANTSTSHKGYLSSIEANELLMVAGRINITGQGMVSAASYDGNAWYPFLVTTTQDGSSGVIYDISMQNSPTGLPTLSEKKYLGRGWIVLIGLAISLVIMSIIILCGILASYIRRRHQGYQIANSNSDYFKDIDGDGHTLVSAKG